MVFGLTRKKASESQSQQGLQTPQEPENGKLDAKDVSLMSEKKSSHKWAARALRVAEIGFLLTGIAAGVALGVLAFQGTVTFMATTFITFSLKPLVGSIAAFAAGYFGSKGCHLARNALAN